jgi:group I intron endonuclease
MDAMIYALRCSENNKHYVGCTGKLQKRFREHRCLLRAGQHVCQSLQADWTQFGEDSFFMIPLEPFDAATASEKRERELKWMRYFEGRGQLYNENTVSYQPPPGASAKAAAARVSSGFKWSEETNLKRSLAQKGKPKGHGAKISATKRAQKAMT